MANLNYIELDMHLDQFLGHTTDRYKKTIHYYATNFFNFDKVKTEDELWKWVDKYSSFYVKQEDELYKQLASKFGGITSYQLQLEIYQRGVEDEEAIKASISVMCKEGDFTIPVMLPIRVAW